MATITASNDIPEPTRQDAAVAGPTAAVMHPGGDTVRRARRTRPSTDVPSDVIRDASISIRALGLLVVFLDLPEDVPIATDQFAGQGNREGRDALRKAMNELITAQYATRRKWQDDRGRWNTETVVYDTRQQPVDNSAPNDVSAGRTEDGFPGFGFPVNKSQSQNLKDQNHLAGAGAACAHVREEPGPVLDDDFFTQMAKQVKIHRDLDITAGQARSLYAAFLGRPGVTPPANPAQWFVTCVKREPDIRVMLAAPENPRWSGPAETPRLHTFDPDPESRLCRMFGCGKPAFDTSRHPRQRVAA